MTEPPLPADNRRALRRVMRGCNRAALGTLLGDAPYVSLVTVALDHDASPILLLSRLADHTRNLDADPRVSLLFDGTHGLANPQTGPRVTIMGRAAATDEPRHRARFLARHPQAAMYAGFADFAVYKVAVERAHFVGGFARAVWFDDKVTLDAKVALAMAAAEADILDHMNRDHAEAVGLMARRLLKARGTGWRLTGIDLEGCDIGRGAIVLRLPFEHPLDRPEQAREVLAALATLARG